MSSVEQISETARAFVSARQQAKGLAAYPGPAPQDLATAYAIQERAIALHGGIVGGWKVGRIWPPMEQVHKANRLAGPIFAHSIGNGSAPVGHVFADGFAAAEAEYLFRLHDDIPATIASLPMNELGALIAAVHVGIEIASSPYIGINADGPAVTISDFGNNNGLIVGAAIDGWSDGAFADWPVQLAIDGVTVGTGIAADFPDGPFGAVRFLLGNLQDRGIAATPGMWISSGAITGVHPVRPGQHVEARFGDRYHMECTIAAVPTPTGTGE